ncbi:MAG: hypothetical protein AVDCRST_MAG08-401, partial [uncultured Acetobacteraceae bacterium]
ARRALAGDRRLSRRGCWLRAGISGVPGLRLGGPLGAASCAGLGMEPPPHV